MCLLNACRDIELCLNLGYKVIEPLFVLHLQLMRFFQWTLGNTVVTIPYVALSMNNMHYLSISSFMLLKTTNYSLYLIHECLPTFFQDLNYSLYLTHECLLKLFKLLATHQLLNLGEATALQGYSSTLTPTKPHQAKATHPWHIYTAMSPKWRPVLACFVMDFC